MKPANILIIALVIICTSVTIYAHYSLTNRCAGNGVLVRTGIHFDCVVAK